MFLKQKVDAGTRIYQCCQTAYSRPCSSTMQAIIDLQLPFFQDGDESRLRPMILKDVAERAKLDISQLSRVSNQQYVQTNFGIYPLKFILQ